MVRAHDKELCKGCKKCQIEINCPMKAAKVVDGKITVDESICNNCGRCIKFCPFHVNDGAVQGFKVYIGGRWGKKTAHGRFSYSVIRDRPVSVLQIPLPALDLRRQNGLFYPMNCFNAKKRF